MAATFFGVFPVLKLNTNMTALLEEVSVDKVAASQSKNRIRVYMTCPRLIAYGDIRKLEAQIEKQLFENTEVRVEVVDRYELSEMYTPERLMSIYFDSFEAELRNSSDLEANIFHKARKEFTGASRMVMTVEDNFITATKAPEIRDKLLHIFQERFGYYVDIEIVYEETKKSRQAEYAEETFQREVRTIVKKIMRKRKKPLKPNRPRLKSRNRPVILRKKIHMSRRKSLTRIFSMAVPLRAMKCRFQKLMMRLGKLLSVERLFSWIHGKFEMKRRLLFLP